MDDLIPVKDNKGLLRDPQTNAIISDNQSSYRNYLRMKEQKKLENKKIIDIESEVTEIKNDINEIKSLLFQILKNES